jgi:hypothetical protein
MGTGEICFQSKRDALISSHTAIEESVPRVRRADYFTEPSAADLISRESLQAGYCSRVHNFVVGRVGYGYVRFFGETDVRMAEWSKAEWPSGLRPKRLQPDMKFCLKHMARPCESVHRDVKH